MASIALVCNTDWSLYRSRGSLIRTLIDKGIGVHCIAPRGDHVVQFEEIGAEFHPWNLNRLSRNPIREFASLVDLVKVLKSVSPTICHTFTAKPNILGPIAARLAGTPTVISTYPGLGHVGQGVEGGPVRFVTRVFRLLAQLSGQLTDVVTFQNLDDMQELVDAGVLPKEKTKLIPGGSGIDTTMYSPEAVDRTELQSLRAELGISPGAFVVLMVGRMLWEKGVREYVAAAKSLRDSLPDIQFLLVGGPDEASPGSISNRQLQEWHGSGDVRHLGHREDIVRIIALADLFVYPSYYREGIPRVLIEAAAMGKPIVSTDSVGCREVVKHESNGLHVPIREVPALIRAIQRLIDDPELRRRYGRASREMAVNEFDERIPIAYTLNLYEESLGTLIG